MLQVLHLLAWGQSKPKENKLGGAQTESGWWLNRKWTTENVSLASNLKCWLEFVVVVCKLWKLLGTLLKLVCVFYSAGLNSCDSSRRRDKHSFGDGSSFHLSCRETTPDQLLSTEMTAELADAACLMMKNPLQLFEVLFKHNPPAVWEQTV